jgi:hypothetical protein
MSTSAHLTMALIALMSLAACMPAPTPSVATGPVRPTTEDLRRLSAADREDELRRIARRGDTNGAIEISRIVARLNVEEAGVPPGRSPDTAVLTEMTRLQAVTGIRRAERERQVRALANANAAMLPHEIRRLAVEAVEDAQLENPDRRRLTGRALQDETAHQQAQLERLAQQTQQSRDAAARIEARFFREHRYCESFAGSASASRGAGARSSAYYDCMESFERVRILSEGR